MGPREGGFGTCDDSGIVLGVCVELGWANVHFQWERYTDWLEGRGGYVCNDRIWVFITEGRFILAWKQVYLFIFMLGFWNVVL